MSLRDAFSLSFRRLSIFFFFNDTATTEIYTLSLHDALPISPWAPVGPRSGPARGREGGRRPGPPRPGSAGDRKSTRLNSSHQIISYAVFCLKKKNKENYSTMQRYCRQNTDNERLANTPDSIF